MKSIIETIILNLEICKIVCYYYKLYYKLLIILLNNYKLEQ